MSTYRERREAKAERLREWADKREAKGSATLERTGAAYDAIPFGQPIMGARDRARREKLRESTGRGFADLSKAAEMRSRADGIEAAAARAIYTDDPDAAERLAEKIGRLEAERDRIKTYNASARKAAKSGGVGDLSILTERERADVATLLRVAPYQLGPGNALPAYKLSNLGGTIRKERQRLEGLGR